MTGNQLQTDVQLELQWEAGVDAHHLVVSVKDGAVTLSGHVPSYFAKTRAVAAVERVHGVKAIADEIEVRLPGTHTRDDSEIATSIAHILKWNAALADQQITAEVATGRVVLQGTVAWNYQREQALSAVTHVLGVTSVTNHIVVKPHVVPARMEREIETALERHAALDAPEIHVATNGSVVVLTGHVRSLDEDRIAKGVAWSAPGISDVDDRLLIRP